MSGPWDLQRSSTLHDASDKYETSYMWCSIILISIVRWKLWWSLERGVAYCAWVGAHLMEATIKMLCTKCRSLVKRSSAIRRRHLNLSRTKTSKAIGSKTVNTDVFVPPTFGRLEVTEQAPLVNAYTTNGFVIRNSFVYGSVALLPRTLLHWKVRRLWGVSYLDSWTSHVNHCR